MDKYYKGRKPATRLATRAALKSVPPAAPDYISTLKQFDLDPRYGPSIGLSREARWQRAKCLGLRPPSEIWEILQNDPSQSGIGFLEKGTLSF